MKIELIKSGAGYTVAVRVCTPYTDIKEQEFIDLVKEFGTVVWKKDKSTTEDYVNFQMRIGYHQAAEMWCNHEKYPQIYRVTNIKIKEEHEGEGMFSHGELDWHCNILFTPDSEEAVALRGVVIPDGSQTIIANSIPYWNNLSDTERETFENIYLSITNKNDETYEKKSVHYMLPTAEQKDVDKRRASRSIQKSMNYDQDPNLFPEPRFQKQNILKMVPKHPLGIKGIYWPHLNLKTLCDKDGNQLSNHKELYNNIIKEYINDNKYHYYHEWEPGDICFMDQLSGVHRRNNVWKEQGLDPKTAHRELQRTSFWYKLPYRTHTDRSI